MAVDAAERAAQRPVSPSALQADRAEGLAEAQQWRNAVAAARMACLSLPNAACQTAITNLQTLLQATRVEELSELRTATRIEMDWMTGLAELKTAFGAVSTACANRD